MSTPRVVRLAEMPILISGSRSPVWWAMIVLIAIESTVFATFISSYFYLRFLVPEWPPAGVGEPDLLLPIVNTGVLLASGVAVLWATSGLKKGDLRRLKLGLAVGLVMEIIFFSIKLVMMAGLEYDWDSHAYGSIYLTIDRFHTGHVLVAILMAAVALVLAVRGYFTRERRVGMEAVNLYWQFVALVWLPVFFVLYLVPRWF